MKKYKLLTPGPLTTTESVKKEMLFDHCTWDGEYKAITQTIRKQLLDLAGVSSDEYTAVLMQGSGTFGVESVFTSSIGKSEKVLICSNGEYGKRMVSIAQRLGVNYLEYSEQYNRIPEAEHVQQLLNENSDITHIAMVHSETTSGILNDIEAVGKVAKQNSKIFIVDAMSSFGGIDIPVKQWGIDFLISSANKCIQGVPGFAFIIARKELMNECKGKARSLALDLYDQWETMEVDGKWRFTSPTHTVLAFAKALQELKQEGGVAVRNMRYTLNNKLLIEQMEALGFKTYIDKDKQGPIIITFLYPDNCNFTFREMYEYIKGRGYAIYPGKLTDIPTFRIGNIGEIYREDIEELCAIIQDFMEEKDYGYND